jgi:hypothetical protein
VNMLQVSDRSLGCFSMAHVSELDALRLQVMHDADEGQTLMQTLQLVPAAEARPSAVRSCSARSQATACSITTPPWRLLLSASWTNLIKTK